MATKLLRTLGYKVAPSRQGKVTLPAKVADAFYSSPPWRELMAGIIRQRGRQCEDIAHDPRRPRSGIRLFGDHIIERKDNPALELQASNIILRCGSCHTRKTAAERGKRYQATPIPAR